MSSLWAGQRVGGVGASERAKREGVSLDRHREFLPKSFLRINLMNTSVSSDTALDCFLSLF